MPPPRPTGRRYPLLSTAGLHRVVVAAPALFTAGWIWSGNRTPDVPHASRSISALSAAGQPCPLPALAGQTAQGLAQLGNAELARRAGMRPLALALALSGLGTLLSTVAPLQEPGGRPWVERVHVWAAGTGMVALHAAPLAALAEPGLPRWSRRGAVASLSVAVPATGYFVHRLGLHGGVGTAYGYAERMFLTALLSWTTSLAAAYPDQDQDHAA